MSAALARDCLGLLELALDAAGWPWRRRLSLWADVLLVIIEETQ